MIARVAAVALVSAVAAALAHHLGGRAVKVGGVVAPQSEWRLVATENGVMEQFQRNGVTVRSRGWQGLRGDPIEILLHVQSAGDTIREGQPMARVVFPLESHQVAAATAELDGARARLRLLQAGPRAETVAAAAAKARSAALASSEAASEAARACSLASRHLISVEEYERVRAVAAVAEADAEAADAEFRLVTAGPRPEEVDALRAEIAALEAAAAAAANRADTTVLTAPIAGVVGDPRQDCLALVQKTDTIAVVLPLDQRVWNRVMLGDRVDITDHRGRKAWGVTVRCGQSASIVGSAIALAAVALVPNDELQLRPGMTVRAVIRTRRP